MFSAWTSTWVYRSDFRPPPEQSLLELQALEGGTTASHFRHFGLLIFQTNNIKYITFKQLRISMQPIEMY